MDGEKRETQQEKVLRILREEGSTTTRDLVMRYVICPPKVIEGLRKKGYKILTEPIEGEKHCKYTLIPTAVQVKLF